MWSQEYYSVPLLLGTSFLSLILIHVLLRHYIFSKPSASGTRLPSPPRIPILGNVHQVGKLTHRSFRSLGEKYGPLLLLHFGSKPVVVVQSADAATDILKKQDLIFADKPNSYATRRILYDFKDISIAPYGEYWRKLKSICALQLLSKKRVQSFRVIREEETALLVNSIKASCLSGLPVNLSELFVSLTNNIVCRSAFGRKREDANKFLELMSQVLEVIANVSVGDFIPSLGWINVVNGFNARVDNIAREIDSFLDPMIEEYLSKGSEEEGGNFMSILLEIYKEDKASFEIDSVKALILDLVLGGTDTTITTLEWAMTELIRHPLVMKKLQQEVRQVMGESGQEMITDADVDKMKYLRAVMQETLRYHLPVAFLARIAREDVKLKGYDISAGTLILINAWAIGRDPTYWDEPEKFMPDRFLDSPIDYRGLDFEFLPFGAGRRQCPGISFAKVNVELVLANMVWFFTWDSPEGVKKEDLDIIEQPGITIRKKNPLIAVPNYC